MSRGILVLVLGLLASRSTAAASDGVRLSLSQVPGKKLIYELRFESIRTDPVELDFDRRRLKITITGRKAKIRHVCRHRKVADDVVEGRRIRLKAEGEAWVERIDLGDYCYSDALETLRTGATIEAAFGKGSVTGALASTDTEPEAVATAEPAVSTVTKSSKPKEDVVQVQLRATRARTPDALRLQVSLRARRGTHWVYPRYDLWRFRVEGPTGSRECTPRRDRIVPIVDFYRRVSSRRPLRQTLMASYACPGVFEKPGVYEVTPIIDLVYSSPAKARPAITGTFRGPPSRVTLQAPRGGSRGVTIGK